MRPRVVVALALLLGSGELAAQRVCGPLRCEKPDLRIGSASVGYGPQAITGLDGGVEDRQGSAVHLGFDLKLLSLLLRTAPIRVYDALSVGLATGSMTSEPLSDVIGEESDGLFSMDFGYRLMAGKQFSPRVALLGGLGWQTSSYEVGRTALDGSAKTIVVRAEYGSFVLTGFLPRGGDKSSGARLDVPFFRRLNLTAVLWTQDGTIESAFIPSGTKASSTTMMLGVRTAELR